MKPKFQIGSHDYTEYIAEEGLKPSTNDLDADGSGRNLLDGLMYRSRVATKKKWTVSFLRLSSAIMAQLMSDMNADYVNITILNAATNSYTTDTYYCSTINQGVQRFIGGDTVYDGVTFSITER